MQLTDYQKMKLNFIPMAIMLSGGIGIIIQKISIDQGFFTIMIGLGLLVFIGTRKNPNENEVVN